MADIQWLDPNLIKKEYLDPNQYAVSLLKEAYRVGVISNQFINTFQKETMNILADLILNYTGKESTSVKIETAEQILNSIHYSLDIYISSFSDPKKAIETLKQNTTRFIYEKGYVLLKKYIEETKLLYDQIVQNKLDVPMETYNDTINHALSGFFIHYDPSFAAQNTMSSMDYPLAIDDMSRTGIRYIREYLEKLEIETEFCKCYETEDINNLLATYGQVYGVDYTLFPINIYEVLLTNAIFSVLSGKSGKELMLSRDECKMLTEKLSMLTYDKIIFLLDEAIKKGIEDLNIRNTKLIDYIFQYKSVLTPRVLNGVKNNNLHNIMITKQEYNRQNSNIIYEGGSKMKDESFREVVEEILQCNNVEDKVCIITSEVQSMKDFVDILKASCLFGSEFSSVFETLEDIELAILGQMVFYDELRKESLNILNANEKSANVEWHKHYIKYMKHLSEDRFTKIESFILDRNIVYNFDTNEK